MANLTTPESNHIWDSSNLLASDIAQFIRSYASIVLLILGIPGQIIILLVLRHPNFKGGTTTFFMNVLAIGDFSYLICRVLQRTLLIWFIRDNLLNAGGIPRLKLFCIQYLYLARVTGDFSKYTLVLLTVDRAFALVLPLKSRQFSTVSTAKIAQIIILIISFALNAPICTSEWAKAWSHWLCPFYTPSTLGYTFLYVGNFSTTACCGILLISNILIMICLRKSTKEMMKMQADVESKTNKKRNAQHRQITIMLLTISFFFVIAMVPRDINLIFWTFASEEMHQNFGYKSLLLEIELFLAAINYTINAYLYLGSNAKFRNTLCTILKGRGGEESSVEKSTELTRNTRT